MFYLVSFNGDKFSVLDDTTGDIEKVSIDKLKSALKLGIEIYGAVLDENINPIYTINGISVNLAYRTCTRVNKYRVALLRKGDRYGSKLSCIVKEPTVFFYDTSVDWDLRKYPCGQFITSYSAKTLLKHKGGLMLDTSVPEWTVEPYEIEDIKRWLSYQLGLAK